ncbi:MAG: 5-formyltetrahydrofolate cyclo-ligase [Bacteroidales bacterium]|nr:5-formyltetrahydrofolate cyclo-ligase [Bacteroidales bacterium]
MNQQKSLLRKHIRELTAAHDSHARLVASETLCKALEDNLQFKAAHTVLLYHSLPDEPDTRAILDKWHRGKRILLPVIRGSELELREYTGPDCLRQEPLFHIEEPQGPPFADFDQVELAIVPGMAFGRQGQRLGRGKGYYDKLLPQLTQAHLIGYCFPWQIVDDIPEEPHDRRVNQVLE